MLLISQCAIMKVVFGLLVVALATVAAEEEVLRSPVYGYHRRVGIPTATRVKAAEEGGVGAGAGRIVGGYPIDISVANYQVGLILQVGLFNSVCGGSLIANNRFLTAAHCINDGEVAAQLVTAVFGTNWLFIGGTRQTFSPSHVILHYGYNPITAINDIALARMPAIVAISDVIQPIALPRGLALNEDYLGHVPRASGYGITGPGDSIVTSQVLSAVYMPTISNFVCAETYGAFVHNSNICTMGIARGICSGDTGGPLVTTSEFDGWGWILVGVSSYYHRDGCELNYPMAYTRVTSFVPWIDWVSFL